eukprot:TRINITY_DN8977_c0_g1_i1.p1 TRINITY_DN8977_c0_g1~~TRINITY_DN8977_c0_g1_i1.p1  ORF type:complete len:102 (-),score=4.08 TRINITY_DN8977_c0_g1_i1:740-1045(-)
MRTRNLPSPITCQDTRIWHRKQGVSVSFWYIGDSDARLRSGQAIYRCLPRNAAFMMIHIPKMHARDDLASFYNWLERIRRRGGEQTTNSRLKRDEIELSRR